MNTHMLDDRSKIPSEVREIFGILETRVLQLHERWLLYRQLFAANEQRIGLLKESAASFFGELQMLWMEYVILDVCRLTDRPRVGKPIERDNLVLRQLYDRLDKGTYARFRTKLDGLLREVENATAKLRMRRNRKLAHLDLHSVLGTDETPVPGISRSDVDEALYAIRQVLNGFRSEFLACELCYENLVLIDDGDTLIDTLRRAAAYRDLEADDPAYRDRLSTGRYADA